MSPRRVGTSPGGGLEGRGWKALVLGVFALGAVALAPGRTWAEPMGLLAGGSHCGKQAGKLLVEHFKGLGFDLLGVDGKGSDARESVPWVPCDGPSCSERRTPVSPLMPPKANPPVPEPWALGCVGEESPGDPGTGWGVSEPRIKACDRVEEMLKPPRMGGAS